MPQQPSTVKRWEDFCLNEWGLGCDEVSDAGLVVSLEHDLKVVDSLGKLPAKGKEGHLTDSITRKLSKAGVLVRDSTNYTVDWGRVEYLRNLVPKPKQAK